MLHRRNFLRQCLVGAIGAVGGTGVYGAFLERHQVEITHRSLDLGLGAPLRVACLGDIHFDPLHEREYLASVVEMVNGTQPDLIALTGDYITHATPRIAEVAALLGLLQAPLGVFACLGNHDQWNAPEIVTALLRKRGITVLRNDSHPLPGRDGWFISALESYWAGHPDPRCLDRTGADSRHLLIQHEPDPFLTLTDPRIRLQLSGHTHGGQVRLPVIGALRLPSWGRKFDEGHFERDGRHLLVNRGIGTVTYHLRFRCRPEISLLELT